MKPTPARVAAVIFDLDGTLADTFDYMVSCFAPTLEPLLHQRLTRAEIVPLFGPGAGTEYQILDQLAGKHVPELYPHYQQLYDANLGSMTLFPGIAEAIAVCREVKIKLGLMTGKGRPSAIATLTHFGLIDAFDVIITGDEATRPKPDPMGVQLALDALQVPARAAIFIGDSRADVLAGQAAGTRTVLGAWHNPTDAAEVAALYHPDVVLPTGHALAAWLRATLAPPSGEAGEGK